MAIKKVKGSFVIPHLLEYRLRMNIKKTKTMTVSRNKDQESLKITVSRKEMEKVKKFLYLGHLIAEDGSFTSEIKRRIEIARSQFISMKDVLSSSKLKLDTRNRLTRCYVLSILLYASESWTINKQMADKIQAFEMWAYWRMLRLSYTESKTNKEVLQTVGEDRTLLHMKKPCKCQYFYIL